MLLTTTLILVAMIALSALEIWLFWQAGERDERSRLHDRRGAKCSEVRTGVQNPRPRRPRSSTAGIAAEAHPRRDAT